MIDVSDESEEEDELVTPGNFSQLINEVFLLLLNMFLLLPHQPNMFLQPQLFLVVGSSDVGGEFVADTTSSSGSQVNKLGSKIDELQFGERRYPQRNRKKKKPFTPLLGDKRMLWDEIGEGERDKMLLQLEQECLNIYRKKVENTRKDMASLRHSLAKAEEEINSIVSALGKRASFPPTLRLQKVTCHLSTIHELSVVMSIGFLEKVDELYPSLGNSSSGYSKSIGNNTLARLTDLINLLKQEKEQRLQKLQDLARMLIELWNLMDTPTDE